jgi:hypothetical protein
LGEKFDEREQKTWKDDHERTKEEACARKWRESSVLEGKGRSAPRIKENQRDGIAD